MVYKKQRGLYGQHSVGKKNKKQNYKSTNSYTNLFTKLQMTQNPGNDKSVPQRMPDCQSQVDFYISYL